MQRIHSVKGRVSAWLSSKPLWRDLFLVVSWTTSDLHRSVPSSPWSSTWWRWTSLTQGTWWGLTWLTGCASSRPRRWVWLPTTVPSFHPTGKTWFTLSIQVSGRLCQLPTSEWVLLFTVKKPLASKFQHVRSIYFLNVSNPLCLTTGRHDV